jgi:hypothetical protein
MKKWGTKNPYLISRVPMKARKYKMTYGHDGTTNYPSLQEQRM